MTAVGDRTRAAWVPPRPTWGSPQEGLPPGPRLPSLVQTIVFLRQRHSWLPRLRARYGDTFTLSILPGPRPFVMFCRPADIKEIFAGDPADFHAGEGNAILRPVMGPRSVLLTDEDEHMRTRKLLMPAFSGATLGSYRTLVEDIARSRVDRWRDGQRLVTLDAMNTLTREVILQVVFGVTDEARLARMRPKVTRMVDIGPGMLLGWAFPGLLRLGPWRRYFANQAEVDTLLYEEIAQRRTSPDLDQRRDVLSRLLQVGHEEHQSASTEPLSEDELRDQLVTLLLAGHETTASALTWTLHELGMNPDVQADAQRAADEGDEAFLEACVKEGMRVHPVIDEVARTLTRPRAVAGWEIPAGATVSPSIRLAHHDPASFADPGRYWPRRFLDERIAPNTWLPFGGGVRRCLGAGFALMEGTVVLREIVSRFTVSVDGPQRTRLRNITSVPARKAPVMLRAR